MQNEAKEDFDQAIGWCVSLITDYRVRLGRWAREPSDRGAAWAPGRRPASVGSLPGPGAASSPAEARTKLLGVDGRWSAGFRVPQVLLLGV